MQRYVACGLFLRGRLFFVYFFLRFDLDGRAPYKY